MTANTTKEAAKEEGKGEKGEEEYEGGEKAAARASKLCQLPLLGDK